MTIEEFPGTICVPKNSIDTKKLKSKAPGITLSPSFMIPQRDGSVVECVNIPVSLAKKLELV